MTELTFALAAMLLLGAFHGLNPGMGWLFAVALGLQERRSGAVWAALWPLALGHAIAIAVAVVAIGLIGQVVPTELLEWGVVAILLGFAGYRVLNQRHPRYGGMQVGPRQLAIWSFLMATAHGAGLMVLPFVVDAVDPMTATSDAKAPIEAVHLAPESHPTDHSIVNVAEGHSGHAHHAESIGSAAPIGRAFGLAATLLHTLGYLFAMGVCAVVVYEKVGLRLLNRAWINLDVVWIAALIATAVFTVVV